MDTNRKSSKAVYTVIDKGAGKSIWVRKNVPLGLDLFGDEEYLLASPPNKASDTLVLRAATKFTRATTGSPELSLTASTRRLPNASNVAF